MIGGGMMGQRQGMMGQGMMGGVMSQMTTHHQQMTEFMNKLMQSMAALQSEKDPAALKSKLAETAHPDDRARRHAAKNGGADGTELPDDG